MSTRRQAGSNLDYSGGVGGTYVELLKALQEEYSDIDADYTVAAATGKAPFRAKICIKSASAEAPTDQSTDYPNSIGDICLYYDTNADKTVVAGVYVATAITLTAGAISAVTWTVLAVTGN